MDKRLLPAIVLSFLILVIYQRWLALYYGPRSGSRRGSGLTTEQTATKDSPPGSSPRVIEGEAPPAKGGRIRDARVETDRYIAVFTPLGGRLKSFALKDYRDSADKNSPPVELVPHKAGAPYPLGLEFGEGPLNDDGLIYSVHGSDLALHGDADGAISFHGVTSEGYRIARRYGFKGSSYAFEVDVSVAGPHAQNSPRLLLTSPQVAPTRGASFEGLLALIGDDLVREPPKNLEQNKNMTGAVTWAGFGYTYFLVALLPGDGGNQAISVKRGDGGAVMSLDGGSADGKLYSTLFMGPKDLYVLKAFGKGLDRSINFGYFGLISMPLLALLRRSHEWTGSYGIDIILLTCLMKLLLIPLTQKGYASMRRMKMLQPEVDRIKEKFNDDKSRLQQEIMGLYRRNRVHPLGGCLPMLLQIPVLTGLYRTLQTPIELRQAAFLWIHDLSRPDWEALPVAVAGWKFGIPVLTLLMGASMIAQQWMTPSVEDPGQRRVLLWMPLVFTVMFINFPSGLTIYWLASNILNVAHQWTMNYGKAAPAQPEGS